MIQSVITRSTDWLEALLWPASETQRGLIGRAGVKAGRILVGLIQDVSAGRLALRATSLTYTTLLALVPLLAVTFSVLKAFGMHDKLRPMLQDTLAPLGEQGGVIVNQVLGFVENVKVGVLGGLGIAVLVYTALSMLRKVELAMNSVWAVPGTRGLARRFSEYLAVILIGPVLILAAVGASATALSSASVAWVAGIRPFGMLILLFGQILPYIFLVFAFAFIYGFLPNTRVRLASAFAGGIFGALAWYALGRGFSELIATSAQYSAIYSGFAGLILFIIWLNFSWVVLLLGAQVSYYWQNPGAVHPSWQLSARVQDGGAIALAVMALVGKAHKIGAEPWSESGLLNQLGVPRDALSSSLHALRSNELLAVSEGSARRYLPTRAPETISVAEILAAGRGEGLKINPSPGVVDTLEHCRVAISDSLGGRSLDDLLRETGPISEA